MIRFHKTCDAAVYAFIESVRAEAERGLVDWHIALFAEDTPGWNTIVIHPGEVSDLSAEITWGANRMARILGAPAAAIVSEGGTDGAVVRVERRGSPHVLEYRLGRGGRPLVAEPIVHSQELLPGGDRREGWGWQDHDSLELDSEMLSGPSDERLCEGEEL